VTTSEAAKRYAETYREYCAVRDTYSPGEMLACPYGACSFLEDPAVCFCGGAREISREQYLDDLGTLLGFLAK
jgi:hypothetical protein